MNEFELHRGLRDLPREREPVRDLWPGIAARIAEARSSIPHHPDCGSGVSRDTTRDAHRGLRRSHGEPDRGSRRSHGVSDRGLRRSHGVSDRGLRRSHGWLALAASLLLAALLVPLSWNQPSAPESTVAHSGTAATPAPDAHEAATDARAGAQQITPASRGLQPYADAMTLEYVAALDQLGGPLLPPALAPVLAELDSSATQIRAALRQDPGATYLLDQLRRTYDQRLRLTQLAVTGRPEHTS